MARAKLTLTFENEGERPRIYETEVTVEREKFEAGERRLAKELGADFTVATESRPEPKHNARVFGWLEFPQGSHDFLAFDDVYNGRELWRELTNLLLSAELDLTDAQSYKRLEPLTAPDFEDPEAVENVYYLHSEKMNHLNRCVYSLIKVQDLVNRLLHETLGGDLVSTTSPDWDRNELRRDNVMRGIDAKVANGELSASDAGTILDALGKPGRTLHQETVVTYRNRLTHHVNPSVDYAMFYSKPFSRTGDPVVDDHGNVKGFVRMLYSIPPIDFSFSDLHVAFSEYLDAVVEMLDLLAGVSILRR